jgi:diguanylate cyclase (GGDEF)-like protein
VKPDDTSLLLRVQTLIRDHADSKVIALDPVTMEDDEGVLERLGVPKERWAGGFDILSTVDPSDQQVLLGHLVRVPDEGEVIDIVRCTDGSLVEAGLFDLRNACGAFVGVTFSVQADRGRHVQPEDRPSLPVRVCHVRLGPVAELLWADDGTRDMLGWTMEERAGTVALDLVHPEDRVNLIGCFLSAFGTPGGTDRARGRLRRADGSWLWAEISFAHGEDGRSIDVEFVDISSEMAAQEQLRARERLLDRLTSVLPVGVLQIDRAGMIKFTNGRLAAMTGVAGATTIDEQFVTVVADQRDRLLAVTDHALVDGRDAELEVRLSPGATEPDRICQLIFRPLLDDDDEVSGAVVCVQDVTEQATERAELASRATRDPLTRTLNRDGIMQELRRAMTAGVGGATQRRSTALVFVDLDGFKRVNDTLGHSEGDRLLRLAVERMRLALRSQDLIGRYGGDEFVAICPDLASPVDAMAVADRIVSILGQPVAGADRIQLRASVGVAISDSRVMTAEQLLAAADRAMYESKRAAEGRPVLATAS